MSCWGFSCSVVRPKSLDAELLGKRHLDKAERLFHGELTGPESFAMYNGIVYTGIHGGFVVQIDEGELKPVVKFGQNCGKGMCCAALLTRFLHCLDVTTI